MNTVLKIKDLKAYYEVSNGKVVKAVDGVSFSVFKNEIFGIAGESGCGKSTLALAITRLLKPPGYVVDGEIVFDNVNLLKLEDEELRRLRWRKISYVPQSSMNALNPVLRIKDQIIDVIKEHEEIKEKEAERLESYVKELLASVGLSPRVANMFPHELSGGMRQRAIIAMAIALKPELLIADEPTTALDVVVQRGILQLLSEIREKYGTSIILITHDMAVHAEIVDRLAIMYAGKIVEMGDVKSVFRDPLHPYTQVLIKSIPSVEHKRKLMGIKGLPPDLKNPPSGCRFHPRCPHKFKPCGVYEPPLVEIKPNRYVACHLYGDRNGG